MSEWRQPYLLSNFDLVTASFTLIAGNSSAPSDIISYRRWTPVVVSSVTPRISDASCVHFCGVSPRVRFSRVRMWPYSSESAVDGSGAEPTFSNSTPLWTRRVASPPSSRIMFGPPVGVFGQVSAFSVHHQYSSSVSPFQAKTGTPCGFSGVPFGPTAMAAAAWSWVEKMLQEAQRTSAPRATRVSIRTAVCTVMCREPVMRAPASGWVSAYSRRIDIRPGISCSARVISLRPKAARERSATLKSMGAAPHGSRGWVRLSRASPVGTVHRALSPSGALSPLGRSRGPPDRHQQRRLTLMTNLHRSAERAPVGRGRSRRMNGRIDGRVDIRANSRANSRAKRGRPADGYRASFGLLNRPCLLEDAGGSLVCAWT